MPDLSFCPMAQQVVGVGQASPPAWVTPLMTCACPGLPVTGLTAAAYAVAVEPFDPAISQLAVWKAGDGEAIERQRERLADRAAAGGRDRGKPRDCPGSSGSGTADEPTFRNASMSCWRRG
jgi:hypothetical protein